MGGRNLCLMRKNKPMGADELRQWMDRTGRSYVEVAAVLAVTTGQVSHLLTGTRTPSLALALRIADVTGISPSRWTREMAAAS
jgi:plasmid maintenance system antidote protein VapI